jgi:nitrate reductase delta subunit
MKRSDRVILGVAARLISYPADDFREELRELKAVVAEQVEEVAVKRALTEAIDRVGAQSVREARERYVATFDLKERTGLYLTAHEFGDSRRRGFALIELKKQIGASGFDIPAGELPDYIPMLYEWVAEVAESADSERVMERLAFATARIRMHLPEDHPYKGVFALLMETVFEPPSEAAMKEREQFREKPDLDPMPYPLFYQ